VGVEVGEALGTVAEGVVGGGEVGAGIAVLGMRGSKNSGSKR